MLDPIDFMALYQQNEAAGASDETPQSEATEDGEPIN
jgi:hypothetical protein